MDAHIPRGVFCRQPEGIPAHRMQHVEPAGALVARDDITQRIVADVSHVDTPRRIGEHFQDVVLRQARVRFWFEDLAVGPNLLPVALSFFGVVAFNFDGGHLVNMSQGNGSASLTQWKVALNVIASLKAGLLILTVYYVVLAGCRCRVDSELPCARENSIF